jgi:hypothetical protein
LFTDKVEDEIGVEKGYSAWRDTKREDNLGSVIDVRSVGT